MIVILGCMLLLGAAAGVLRSAALTGLGILLMAGFILAAPCCRRRQKLWFFVLYSALMTPVHLLWVKDVVMDIYLEGMYAGLYDRLYGDVITMALLSAELIAVLRGMDLVFRRQRAVRRADSGEKRRAA